MIDAFLTYVNRQIHYILTSNSRVEMLNCEGTKRKIKPTKRIRNKSKNKMKILLTLRMIDESY